MRPPSPGTSGHSATYSSNGRSVEAWASSTPFLMVEAWNAEPGDELEFHLHDETGREIKIEADAYDPYDALPGGGRRYRRAFDPPDGVKAVTLQVVVNRPLPFEF